MISDEKRREVAQELRELRHTTKYREEVVENICDVISIADPVNTFREPEDVYKLLADLIDRPTCRIYAIDHEYEDSVRCDRCLMTFRRPWEPFKYCPNCGAEVKDDAEPNLKEN